MHAPVALDITLFIELMEARKVARPSTNTSAVEKLLEENAYAKVTIDGLKLTEQGRFVLEMLDSLDIPKIDDLFTYQLEKDLELIARGKAEMEEVILRYTEFFKFSR